MKKIYNIPTAARLADKLNLSLLSASNDNVTNTGDDTGEANAGNAGNLPEGGEFNAKRHGSLWDSDED